MVFPILGILPQCVHKARQGLPQFRGLRGKRLTGHKDSPRSILVHDLNVRQALSAR